MYPFRRLAAWRRAHALAIHVYQVTERLKGPAHPALISQMRRSAQSIPANIAAGTGRASEAQFARFLEMALGSARELDYHALLAHDLGLFETVAYTRLEARVDEVCRILVVLHRKVARNAHAATAAASRTGRARKTN